MRRSARRQTCEWFWSVTAIVPAMPGVTNGTAATRVEAVAKFRTDGSAGEEMTNADKRRRRSTIIKHSIAINRHKTSVTLEQEFWSALREIYCRALQ
jgi:hypothetical protein